MFIDIILPLALAVLIIILIENYIDDSTSRQLIYMVIIGACILKYMLIAKSIFTMVFAGTYVVFYFARYMFRLS